MYVFRIQNKDNRGPYCTPFKYQNRIRTGADKHPSPRYDGIETRDDGCFYGFTSFDDLLNWFDKVTLKLLKREGYYLAIWSILSRRVFQGARHCSFRPVGREKPKLFDIITVWDMTDQKPHKMRKKASDSELIDKLERSYPIYTTTLPPNKIITLQT